MVDATKEKDKEKQSDCFLLERVALPGSLIGILTSEGSSRVDGFILTPFRYTGDGTNKIEYAQRFIIRESNVMNGPLNMNLDYRARIVTDILAGTNHVASVPDTFQLMHQYNVSFQPMPMDYPLNQPVAFDAMPPIIEEDENLERLRNHVIVEEPVDVSSRSDSIISGSESLIDQHLSSDSTPATSVVAEDLSTESVEETWAMITGQKPCNPFSVYDYLYHGVAYESTSERCYDHEAFMLVKRVFKLDGDNVPSLETGALLGSITYMAKKDSTQYTCYIVVSRPKRPGNTKNGGGYQIALILQRGVAMEVFAFRYPRAEINALMVFNKDDLLSIGQVVRFFSREFGSFHVVDYPSNDQFYREVEGIKKRFKSDPSLDIASAGLKFMDLVKQKMINYGEFIDKRSLFGYPSPGEKFDMIAQGLRVYTNKMTTLYPTREERRCLEEMVRLIGVRRGIVYGSKVVRKKGFFETPCNEKVESFSDYASHCCAVRVRAHAIVSRHDLESKQIITSNVYGTYCPYCYRLYEFESDADLCAYFCLIGAKEISGSNPRCIKDGFGRDIND